MGGRMKTFKKAFLVIPHWADNDSVSWGKSNSHPIYAETASKAKYDFYLGLEMDDNDWFKYRSLRWPEMDLMPPVLHPMVKEISKSALDKMVHTCGAATKRSDRNYYNGPVDDEDFKILIEKKLSERNSSRDGMLSAGTTYYHLTELGLEVARSTQSKIRGKS